MTAANAFHPISLITAAQTSSQAVALPKEKKNKNFAKKSNWEKVDIRQRYREFHNSYLEV